MSLPGDMMGLVGSARVLGSRPTGVGDVMVKAAAVMAIVAVVKKYADLNAAQRSRVERVVAQRYQRQIETEKRALAPKYAARRSEVKRKAAEKVAQVRQTSPAQAAKVEAEAKKEVAEVDTEWQKAAASSVSSKYGTNYAVPMSNPEGKPVVAFASVRDGQVDVASSAYEVGGKVAEGSKVTHGGREYAVVGERVSF
jgi:Zn-dependent oligopeptidase